MSNPLKVPYNVALAQWVKQAAADPIQHKERQVTEILLHAIGITPALHSSLVLKGGVLMSLAHGSYRQTGDVDFSALTDPEPYAGLLRNQLDTALTRAAADLGYADTVCAVQRFDYKPRPQGFAEFTAPALKLSIGYATRGTQEEKRLADKKAVRVLQVDISFRETVVHASELTINEPEVMIQAYDVEEIIAEKLRALLQQPIRNRSRRQDVYDIDWLITRYQPDAAMRSSIYEAFLIKSDDRSVGANANSLENPEVISRAKAEWETLKMEIGGKLPPFDDAFARVLAFYKGLPWTA